MLEKCTTRDNPIMFSMLEIVLGSIAAVLGVHDLWAAVWTGLQLLVFLLQSAPRCELQSQVAGDRPSPCFPSTHPRTPADNMAVSLTYSLSCSWLKKSGPWLFTQVQWLL